MNPEVGNLKYDYSDLDRFLRTFDKKHLSRCYRQRIFNFDRLQTDLVSAKVS